MDINLGDRTISVQLRVDDVPNEGGGCGLLIKRSISSQNPIFPGSRIIRKKFVDELHQEASILRVQIFQPQPTFEFASADVFPGNEALGAMAGVVTGPEESTATTVDSFDNRFMQAKGGHVVKREGAKDTGTQGKASSTVQKGSPPPGEVFVTGSKERLAVGNGKLVRREREAKVGLRKGGNRSTKEAGKMIDNIRVETNGKKGGLMVVNREPGC
jgi:hypothetical protein